jgi:hypothetical protein
LWFCLSNFPITRLLNYPISKYLESLRVPSWSFMVKLLRCCLSNYPITLGDCWVFNFGDFGSSGNFGNLFCCRAMTAITAMTAIPLCSFVSSVVKAFDLPIAAMTRDAGDHGDSSITRLLNYPISKYPPSPIPVIPIWRTLHPTRCSCGTAPGPPTGPGLACWGGGAPGCG